MDVEFHKEFNKKTPECNIFILAKYTAKKQNPKSTTVLRRGVKTHSSQTIVYQWLLTLMRGS